MTFQEIFSQAGLYTSESFRDGVAIKITKSTLHNDFEATLVEYDENSTFEKSEYPLQVSASLFKKDYKQVLTVFQLFGDRKSKLIAI
jgi:hypothetical protein